MLCDNKYNILAISNCISGNHHDNFELVDKMEHMIESLNKQHINYHLSHLNADSGFDVKKFIEFVNSHKMTANIKQNKRNQKKKEREYRYMSEYIYQFRFKIEVVFAWLDTYKRILIRFEYRARNFMAWLHIAAAMINFRNIFN